jgi:hypothetical protein
LFLLHSRSRKFPGNNEKGRRNKEKYAPPSPAARPNFFKLRIADDGTMSPIYGGKGGDTEFRLLLNQSGGKWTGHLRGFWSLSENAIEALGLIFWPIE